jgi:hypothetical protein
MSRFARDFRPVNLSVTRIRVLAHSGFVLRATALLLRSTDYRFAGYRQARDALRAGRNCRPD